MPMINENIQSDDARRLRNAVLAMALMDRGWMWWVERNIPRRADLHSRRIWVERRARVLVANNYGSLGRGTWLAIVESDYYFTDDGNLKTYL